MDGKVLRVIHCFRVGSRQPILPHPLPCLCLGYLHLNCTFFGFIVENWKVERKRDRGIDERQRLPRVAFGTQS